jgi:aspartate/methionine/tyrosine aminotransferase
MRPFKLERYFAATEFKVEYLLSASDCEGLAMAELLEMASPASLDLWRGLKLNYTESPGHAGLRSEIAGLYRNVAPDGIVVAAPEEAIFVAMQTMLEPGDHVIAVIPTYQSLTEIARAKGCRVSPWRLEPGPGGWRLDFDRLKRLANRRTRMLVVNFPNNPTGAVLSPAELEAVVEFARERDLILFSDEMYRLLEWDPALRRPAVCDLYEKGISLSGLSKSFALPGLRIGWLATQDAALTDRWLAMKDYTTICSSAPSEILAIIALQSAERILRRNCGIIRKNLALAERFFGERTRQFDWIAPRAGSVAFPRWRGAGSVARFCRDILDRKSVMIVPGGMFDVPGSHFRIGLGRKNFGKALARVGEFLGERAEP